MCMTSRSGIFLNIRRSDFIQEDPSVGSYFHNPYHNRQCHAVSSHCLEICFSYSDFLSLDRCGCEVNVNCSVKDYLYGDR